ncbi:MULTISPECIES: enoyl-CoA hydratase-related protein [Saccharopolyspora]|uniref:Enoyl-CoA hydratase-related protein n=1 Tax=Saccharopolyspora gregorii TaxID=33914 RepID=A0ABP6RP68_9PSEU|nr:MULTISPECIES: enoyl-CoA hydratase-related protein [Saccharopolyspora]MCA1185639.1 enoyl-CoA hydratase/isomerase family protein [Saccharopolyspora sp. 6T]MCA1280695.1 enoyl-CoA hydratase/isomerase family protein [Saccharopolyspora sp. 7B]
MPEDDEILVEHRDAVLLLTFNRPDRLNAWTPSMRRRYFDLLEEADADPSVRAVVVTGAGRGFCAGTDLSALGDTPEPDVDERAISLSIRIRKPIIAAINGPVAGIGLVAALFADVRFAAEDAKFTTAFSRRGLVAEHGISWLLPKLVGAGAALDLMLSARTLPGTEAHRMGLVDRVLPASEVLAAALEYAHVLATECSPASLADIKEQIYSGLDSGLETARADASNRMVTAFGRPDVREGVRSFHERRRPDFPPLGG